MGLFSRKEISYKYIYILVLWLCQSNGVNTSTDFKVFRGEQDIFTNPGYEEDGSGSTDPCSRYNARCENNVCDYCRCREGKNTLIIDDYDGDDDYDDIACKSDEEIVPESVPEDKFWLENTKYKECLKLDGSSKNHVIRTNCSSSTLDMYWIWTPTGNKQLINVKTLTCMEKRGGNEVLMKQCNKRKINCTGKKDDQMEIKWNNGNRFLHLPKMGSRVIFKIIGNGNKKDRQQWSSNVETPCRTSETYNGCYRFSDGSFLKYLNHSTTEPKNHKLRISAPIFKNHDECELSNYFTHHRDNDTGESKTVDVFSFNKEDKTIEFKSGQFDAWNGSLIKLSVVCEDKNDEDDKEEHCILLKLASKPSFSEVIHSTETPSEATTATESTASSSPTTTGHSQVSTTPYSRTGESTIAEKTNTQEPNTLATKKAVNMKSTEQEGKKGTSSEPPKTSTTIKPLGEGSAEASESGGTNSSVIAVTVTLFVVALVLVLGFLVYCRRRKRAQGPQSNNIGIGVANNSSGIYEDPYRIYDTIKDDKNAVSQEYTYAKETDFPRSSVGMEPEAKGQINNGAVYETLYQPGQSNNDGFYNYPENKPPAYELEYTYAKDTDIPRVNIDKTEPQTPAAANAVYHTLEKEEQQPTTDLYKHPGTNISTEPEYTYAKDNDIPRVNIDKTEPQTPAANAVYHTLDEEEQQPTTDLYKHPGANISPEPEYAYAKNNDVPRNVAGKTALPEEPDGNLVYQTLEQEQPSTVDLHKHPGASIPNELEYTYAKDTEIPRIAVNGSAERDSVPATDAEQRNEYSGPQNDTTPYHTLEEPPPVYSTLEGPDDVDH